MNSNNDPDPSASNVIDLDSERSNELKSLGLTSWEYEEALRAELSHSKMEQLDDRWRSSTQTLDDRWTTPPELVHRVKAEIEKSKSYFINNFLQTWRDQTGVVAIPFDEFSVDMKERQELAKLIMDAYYNRLTQFNLEFYARTLRQLTSDELARTIVRMREDFGTNFIEKLFRKQ
jgi:hypothetical protein